MISTWRDVSKKDGCRDKLKTINSCNKPFYRVACKRLIVNRNCLTRSEHTEVLSTPKGYLWAGTRGMGSVLKNCKKINDSRRRSTKPKKDADTMWQEYTKQFLKSANGSLSPTTKTILPKILMSKKNISDPKWSNYPNTQAKLCGFFNHLNLQCNSGKWKQNFLQSLSSLIFDYIVQVLYCDRLTKKNKLLTSEILNKINNITQEHGSPKSSPDNYLKGVQIFLANILSPWLVKSITDFCQGSNTNLQITNANNGLVMINENRSKILTNTTKVKTKKKHEDAVNSSTRRFNNKSSTKKKGKTENTKSPMSKILKNKKNKNKMALKSDLTSTKITNRGLISNKNIDKTGKKKNVNKLKIKHVRNDKKLFNENQLKTQYDQKDNTIRKNNKSSNEQLLESESQIKYNTSTFDDNKAINKNKISINEKLKMTENDQENNYLNNTNLGNDGEIIAIKSGDRENNPNNKNINNNNNMDNMNNIDNMNNMDNMDNMDNMNNMDNMDNINNIDNENNEYTKMLKTKLEDSKENVDQLNYKQSYDIQNEGKSKSRISKEMNAFLDKLSTNDNKHVTKTTTNKLDELEDICFQRFSNNKQKFTVDETKNKELTDIKKCGNQNPGIQYRICKKDGSNYSVRKMILPTRENSNSTLIVDPTVKAKLIVKNIKKVDRWKFDLDKRIC